MMQILFRFDLDVKGQLKIFLSSCSFLVIVKLELDSSSNSYDITIKINTTLTSVSRSSRNARALRDIIIKTSQITIKTKWLKTSYIAFFAQFVEYGNDCRPIGWLRGRLCAVQ